MSRFGLHYAYGFYEKFQEDEILNRAASLTYTSVLSLVPMLALGYFLFSALGGFDKAEAQLEQYLAENLAPAYADQIFGYVTTLRQNLSAKTLGVFGLLGFVITSILMLTKVETAFNEIWGVTRPRNWVRRITSYWTMMTLAPIFLGLSLVLTSNLILWLEGLGGDLAKSLVALFTVMPYVFSSAVFVISFYILPSAEIDRRLAVISGVLTGIAFEIAKQLYAWYATVSMHSNVYGKLAVLPVFLVWLNLIWVITLCGFELCSYMQMRQMGLSYRSDAEVGLNTLLLFDILEALGLKQKKGQGYELNELGRGLKVGRRRLIRHLDYLQELNLVVENQSEKKGRVIYYLTTNMSELDPVRILEQVRHLQFEPVGPATRKLADDFLRISREWRFGGV